MIAAETQTPILAVGARVEVAHAAGTLACALQAVHRRMLHLTLPLDARRPEGMCDGTPVLLTLFLPISFAGTSGACLETEAAIREWIWKRPPLLVVGPVHEWRERPRRAARRERRHLSARIVMEDGREFVGRTQDISASGVSLMITGLEDVCEGTEGRLTLQVDDGLWCDDLPVRVARVRHWLRSAGRSVEIGAQLQLATERQNLHWNEALRWLGLEE
jgi:hypothetical protein